jgi:hypothetical protein
MSGIIAQNVGRHGGLIKAPSGGGGAWTLIQTQTASSSADISFTSGLDSTYDEYCFKFINIHPETDNAVLTFNLSTDSGSNYNVTKTTTFFRASKPENDDPHQFDYIASFDLAQGTGYQNLIPAIGADGNDSSGSGYLYLYNPSNTTYVKHFIGKITEMQEDDKNLQGYVAGYGNTTSAVDAVDFKMSSGNMDAGTISLYGIT